MDIGRRLVKVIKYLGYVIALYLSYEFFYLDPKFSSQIFSRDLHYFLALAVCGFLPVLIEYILAGTDGFDDD